MTQKLTPTDIGEAGAKLGIVMVACSAERAEATMPVAGNRQPFGLLHGGASALLAEQVASVAACEWARQDGKNAVGANLQITHVRSAAVGLVRCVAEAQHLGRRTAVYSFQITEDGTGKLISFGTVSCQVVPAVPDGTS